MSRASLAAVAAAVLAIAGAADAALPDTKTLMGDLGFSADEIARVQAGEFVRGEIEPASERELVTAVAFRVGVPPPELIAELEKGLLVAVDENTIATGAISTPASSADLAKLTLQPQGEKRAKGYTEAKPGGDLNLSSDEIAAFGKLGADASVAAVEEQVRAALVARVEAYRSSGLSGIAPYARKDGERSPAEELRIASRASTNLKTYVPALYELLLSYPRSKPPGTEETFRWTQLDAQGVPTITLTHGLTVPEGDAWVAVQRQFYVSAGYNAEQAIAALLPVEGGTVVLYFNHTSTDQVSGFGGGAKRSLGSKILASELEALFEKVRAAAK